MNLSFHVLFSAFLFGAVLGIVNIALMMLVALIRKH